MLKKIMMTSGALLISSMAFADYQFTVDGVLGAGTRDYDTNAKDDVDYDLLGVGGKFYFTRVSTASGPIREAAFMGRQSNVGVSYERLSFDREDKKDMDDDKTLMATVDWHIGDSNFLVGGALGNHKADNYKADIIGITGGYWIVTNGLLKVTLWDESGENTSSKDDSSISALEVDYRQLIPIGQYQLAIEGNVSSASQDNDNTADKDTGIAEIKGVFYLNNQLGLGAEIRSVAEDSDAAGGDSNSSIIAATVSYEFTDMVGISGKVGLENGTEERVGKDVDFSGSVIEVGVQGRF